MIVRARALYGAISIMTGTSYVTSAEMAKELGTFQATKTIKRKCLRYK